MRRKTLVLGLFVLISVNIRAIPAPDTSVNYKVTGDVELGMDIFFPPDHRVTNLTPAIIFFHGGGWISGDPSHFYGQCEYFASRGMVAASVQYRLEEVHHTTPAESVMDAKSAIRWIRTHAVDFGIDPDKVVAAGGSAGGHLAAATAVLQGFDEPGEDHSVSCRPQALVLLNPVLHNGPEGYGYNRVKEYWQEISPFHNLHENGVPTLIMLGTEDNLFKPGLAEAYKEKMEKNGVRCDVILYEGQTHAFFNQDRSVEMYLQTMADADKFLVSLGYLQGKPEDMEKLKAKYVKSQKPNLLIIHTDEHNLRTLGCYRETMTDEHAFKWGKEAIVETPNIDRLAMAGALCKNWYATSPVCTPSRASLVTGLYPVATGSPRNDMPLNDNVITFAEILKNNGYATSYVGKWHLDGEAKPGFQPARKFGFEDNRYMFNRGHWKTLGEDENGPVVLDQVSDKGFALFNPDLANEENFTTDFLVNRAIEIIDRDKDEPFCLMLSIPDPHGPDQVRNPYREMYANMQFERPGIMQKDDLSQPGWNRGIETNKLDHFFERGISQYFGMVKCIDDNVGRLMAYLEEEGLDRNTIVVFTSDHGDLMGEHGKLNKGLPYEMSARVAFLLKYPEKVLPGKQIEKAFTMADFTPTILGLMGIDHSSYTFHGTDASKDFLSKDTFISDDRIVYLTNAFGRWVAAVNNRYKLVMSPADQPWLFDLQEDPEELVNFYGHPDYEEIAHRFQEELFRQMELYDEPLQIDELQ